MAISDRTIEQLQEAVRPEIIKDSAGREYVTRIIQPLPVIKQPTPDPLSVHTLDGILCYLADPDRAAVVGMNRVRYIHVVTHNLVRVLSELYGPGQRDVLCMAKFEDVIGPSFRFGTFTEQDDFVTALQALFVPTPVRDAVLRVIGNIKSEEVRETNDDGITQTVAARSGIALIKETFVPNPVLLAPYRTFPEISQPESLFVLRVKHVKGQNPLVALFEADGGRWKVDAIASIGDFFERGLKALGIAEKYVILS